jgi:hypothetical protein
VFRESFEYYHNSSLDWFFEDLQSSTYPLDVTLHKSESCPTLFVNEVSQSKKPAMPFPISGYIEDSLVISEWTPYSPKRVGRNFYQAPYTRVVAADPHRYPELNGKDNYRRTKGWFKGVEPLRFQLYTSLEDPAKTQIYWLPLLSYNAYDQVLFGAELFNTTLIPKRLEYRIAPQYSTGTQSLTGYSSVVYNKPFFSGAVRRIRAGIFTQRFHYDQGLAYTRISPGMNIYFRKPNPRDLYIRRLSLRHVWLDRELPTGEEDRVGAGGYSVGNLRYRSEYTHILYPRILNVDFQIGDLFSKVSVELDQRWMLPNRKWLIFRGFAGWMPYNNNPADVDLFDFGLSGTQDYLFDYYFIGRSDETGIWSQQMFITDGGFRNRTDVFARNTILATNLSVPIYSFFGVYGDMAMLDDFDRVYYGCGIRLAFLTDFLEWYFPLASESIQYWDSFNYLSQTRFVLNLDIDDIITRIRRGFY